MRVASLGMYDHPAVGPANDLLWRAIARRLAAKGLTGLPHGLERERPLAEIWDDPRLLLAQTCGYPFVTRWSGRLRYVATPRYRAEGCAGPRHRSRLVVRKECRALSLADMRGRRAVANEPGSNSGVNLFRAVVARFAGGAAFFSDIAYSGSHRESARRVAAGEADIAAVDAVTFALLERHEPGITRRLRTLAWTPAVPGLPLVTALATGEGELAALRDALAEAACDPDLARVRHALLIDGFEVIEPARYGRVLALEQAAVRAGYPVLA